jgi:hypothetical protein
MKRDELLGYGVWSVVAVTFAVPEITAAVDNTVPWPTISGTIGELEWVWSPTSLFVVAIIVYAAAHAVWPLSRTPGGRYAPRAATGGVVSPLLYFPIAIACIVVGSVIAAESASDQYDLGYVLYPLIAFFTVIVPSALAVARAWDVPFPTLFRTIANLENRLHVAALVIAVALVILLIHLAFYPWPKISHVLQVHHPTPTSK